MKKLFSKKLWTVLSVVLCSVLAFVVSLTYTAYEHEPVLNDFFKLQGFKKIDDGDGSGAIATKPANYTTTEQIREFFKTTSYNLEAEGLVLLKNEDDTLPFDTTDGFKVSLFGTGSVDFNASVQGMRGFGPGEADLPTLEQALAAVDVEANPSLIQFYKTGPGAKYGHSKGLNANNLQVYKINEVPWNEYAPVRSSFKDYGDAAIVVLSRDSTEGSDTNVTDSDGINGNYLSVSPEELELLKQLTSLKGNTFESLIVILNGPQPMQLDFLYDEHVEVDACLWVGTTGMTGINALADALVGKVIPSGRLTDTFVKDNLSSPAMASWALNENSVFSNHWTDSRLGVTNSYYGVYVEGIYVGYRYYETRYADVVEGRRNVGNYNYESEMAYPFGYGLSYSEFAYSNFSVKESDDGKSYDVSVTVKNTGAYPAKEAVHIYLQKPYTKYAIDHAMEVSAIDFVGFTKTEELDPGESVKVTVPVEKTLFTSYDVYGIGSYILDGGDYYLTTGRDVHKALNNILAKKGYGVKNGMTEEGDASLVWTEKLTQDKETYTKSDQTGYEITNQLGDYDPQRYVGTDPTEITYVSRNNWTETWPTTKATLTLTDEMYKALQPDSPVESVGQLPTLGRDNGMTLAMLYGKPYGDDDWDKILDQLSFADMNTLLTTAYCRTAEINSISKPLTKEMDGPTYAKESTNECRLPCEGIWAATFNSGLLAAAGEALSADCLFTGYHGMWIPGINIHRTPYSGRNHEYFSEDPVLTGLCAQYEIEAIQEFGVIAFPKHFIFNDQEANRNGIGIWLNEQSAREIYLQPWKYACGLKKANAHGVMSSFNRAGCAWTSASYGLVTEILKNEFGFDGFIITDMADSNGSDYMSCLDGIVAGTETWLSSGANHTFNPYKNNATVVNAMREACHRVLYATVNFSAAMNGYTTTTRQIKVYTWWEITVITLTTVTSVLAAGSLVMLCLSTFKKRKEDKTE